MQPWEHSTPRRADLGSVAFRSIPSLIFGLTLFPNVAFFPFIPTNNQPVAAIAIMAFWLVFRRAKISLNRFTSPIVILIVLLTIYAVFTAVLRPEGAPRGASAPGFITYFASYREVGLTYFSYLIGPTIFLYLLYNFRQVSPRVVEAFLIFQGAICLLQTFGNGALRQLLASGIGWMFIGFSSEPFAFGRGVAGTFPEPSHLGRYLIVLAALLLYFRSSGQISRRRLVQFLSLIGALVIMNQSLTFLTLLLVWLSLQAVAAALTGRFKQAGAIVFGLLLAGQIMASLPATSRLSTLPVKMTELSGRSTDFEVLDLQLLGGIRLIHMLVGYRAVTLFPAGQGLGSYLHNLPETAGLLGINIYEAHFYRHVVSEVGRDGVITKPNGYAAQLTYDMGVFGLAAIALLIFTILSEAAQSFRSREHIWPVPLLGVFLLMFYTTTSFPVPWIMLAFVNLYRIPALPESGPAAGDAEAKNRRSASTLPESWYRPPTLPGQEQGS
jgi:hypothetical protein